MYVFVGGLYTPRYRRSNEEEGKFGLHYTLRLSFACFCCYCACKDTLAYHIEREREREREKDEEKMIRGVRDG